MRSSSSPFRYPSDLTDAQWALIEPLVSVRSGGRPAIHPRRRIVEAILYLNRTGCSWRQLPDDFPPWDTVYWYFRRWNVEGTIDRIHDALRAGTREAAGTETTRATSDSAAPPRRTPLHDRHVGLGAKMADFGGWLMPIEYAGGGVVREHTAVRERVGLFDVSHLGKALVRGPGAADFVNEALTNDLRRIAPGQAQYTLCCTESGGVVDDLIVYLRSLDELLLVPNAANTAEIVRRLRQRSPAAVEVTDEHQAYGVLAVQGTKSDDVLEALGLPAGHDYMTFVDATWRGIPLVVCRTGYTGERGYELMPPWDATVELWDALVAAVTDQDGLPAGLGARDTLRTEMGYPLHGHELSLDISPVQARAGWAVGWNKAAFWGRDALVAQKQGGVARQLWGLLALDRGIPRDGCDVRAADAADQAVLGRTTSGTFSPSLKQGIALALLERAVSEGDEVVVDVRGRGLRCRVVKPPFVQVQPRSS